MNNREIRFRESFRGYNRDDVKAYIEQLNIIFARKEAELCSRIAELESKLKSISEQPVPSHTDEEWNELALKLEGAENEIKRINEEKANEAEAEKSRLYDEMSAQVGNIIISANANADKIVSDAKDEASRIRNEANEYANCVKTEADKTRDEIVANVNTRVRDFAIECVTQYGTIIGETNAKLGNIADNLKSRSEALLSSLESKTKDIEAKLTFRNEE